MFCSNSLFFNQSKCRQKTLLRCHQKQNPRNPNKPNFFHHHLFKFPQLHCCSKHHRNKVKTTLFNFDFVILVVVGPVFLLYSFMCSRCWRYQKKNNKIAHPIKRLHLFVIYRFYYYSLYSYTIFFFFLWTVFTTNSTQTIVKVDFIYQPTGPFQTPLAPPPTDGIRCVLTI